MPDAVGPYFVARGRRGGPALLENLKKLRARAGNRCVLSGQCDAVSLVLAPSNTFLEKHVRCQCNFEYYRQTSRNYDSNSSLIIFP